MLSQREMDWLEESLEYLSVKGAPEVEPVMGDASARSYYRIKLGSRTFILCRSADLASNERFRKVSAALEQVGVMSPLVFAFDDVGLMLMSDMGNTQLIDFYQMNAQGHPYSLIHRVLMDLIRLAQIPDPLLMEGDHSLLASYDQTLLDRDFGLFTEWCCQEALGLSLSVDERATLKSLASMFAKSFDEQPQVWVHRDFHSRNLMITDNDIAMIDFQDMVKGPVCYDLISLVYDAYWQIPDEDKDRIIKDFYSLASSEGLIDIGYEDYTRWVALTAMQRLIKILGIFCRLALRDGKTTYLNDLPMVITHIDSIHANHAEAFGELQNDWLDVWHGTIKPSIMKFLEQH